MNLGLLFFKFLESVKDAYLEQHIKQPTRGRGTDIPSTLDLILTRGDDVLEDIAVEAPLGKSDHAVIKASLLCNYAPKPIKKTRFLYDQADYKKLKDLLPQDWDSILKDKNLSVDEMWTIFKDKLTTAINESIPKKTVTLNGRIRRGKKMDRKALSKIKRKYRLWENYIKTGDGRKYLEYCRVRKSNNKEGAKRTRKEGS